MLDEVLQDVKKHAQKMIVCTAIGASVNQRQYFNKEKAKQNEESERTSVKVNMTSFSETITHAVKGQFGKQVKETFNVQNEKLDKF